MSHWRGLFLEHPEDLGETYVAHFGAAAEIGLALIGAGAACLVHAAVPALFGTTATRTIGRLHERLAARAAAA